MITLITKIKSAISTVALFAIGTAMAFLGLMVVGTLAMFAMFALGLSLLAAPFIGLVHTPSEEDAENEEAAPAAA